LKKGKKLEREMLAVLGEKEGYEMFFVGVASPSQLSKALLQTRFGISITFKGDMGGDFSKLQNWGLSLLNYLLNKNGANKNGARPHFFHFRI
jgi:hypothetical protein